MKIYLVGGAVRDELLGLAVAERDWVVVGADTAAMRAKGFVPADRDFPVFLHPETGEEYALARREVKSGEGYRGFDVYAGPDVTLEEDLRRRDLTINAMARDERGLVIDPYGGRDDLDAGLLRHVSPAFVEDPLRVLRVARFAARLGRHGFHVAHATHRLMRDMVERGDMGHLNAERLWREMYAAMQAEQPWRFFEVLQRIGALETLIPPLAAAMGERLPHAADKDSAPIAALKRVAAATMAPAQRLAATLLGCVEAPDEAERIATMLRADRETANLLKRAATTSDLWGRVEQGDVAAMVELARIWRAYDDPVGAEALVAVCAAQSEGSRAAACLKVALPAARRVSADALRGQGLEGAALGTALADARQGAMRDALAKAGLVSQAGQL
jgi:tRNA nucleotidyltransferase (CCA-adding enzyme)